MCELYDRIQQEGIAIGEAKGREKGRAEGRAEGEAKGKSVLLKKLFRLGNTVKQLAAMFEMPESEIESLLSLEF